MIIVSESMLTESKSARDGQLANMPQERSQDILNKVKTLYFALWRGTGMVTTEQVAAFYEVPESTVRQALRAYRVEFESDGLKTLKKDELDEVREEFSLSSRVVNATAWTPRAALRLGMVLRDSPVGWKVRDTLLNAAESTAIIAAPNGYQLSVEMQEAQAAFLIGGNFSKLLIGAGVDPAIAALVELNHIERVCPMLKATVEESRKLIGGANATESQYLTPTELGDRVGMKSRAVNSALVGAGLQMQTVDAKGKKKWDLTDEGKKYGIVFLASGQNNRWSGGQIKWLPSVLDVLSVQQSA